MKRLVSVLACGAFIALAAPALADDSSAMLGAGGIVLTRNDDIRMASEDLYLSPTAVRVHYTFANDSKKNIDTIVAFPLPDIDNYEYAELAIGTTLQTTPNFVGFRLSIDGKTIAPTAEERAIYKGKDVTALVRAARVPLNIVIGGGYDKLQKITPAARAMLLKAGLILADPGETVYAKWTTQTKFWWRMTFPAGRTVSVDHTYQPVTGQTFFTTFALSDATERAGYEKDYCLDASTKASIRAGFVALRTPDGGEGYFNQYTTDFVIVTANNWKGPIGRFHLTIDKAKPGNILSMCWTGDLKKTGATTFESTLTNFAPKRDIQFLVLERPPKQ